MEKFKTIKLWGNELTLPIGNGVVIMDLDGTLSDGSHRLHMLPTKDLHLTESWREFNKAAKDDAPIENTIKVANALWESGMCVIILTGRSDEVAHDTYLWLRRHNVMFDYMIMRRAIDNRKDTVIKQEVLEEIGLENIVCAFDDSPSVIAHFRSLGITTYQVTEYDKPHSHLQSHGVDELDG